jgi:hypothetical protein
MDLTTCCPIMTRPALREVDRFHVERVSTGHTIGSISCCVRLKPDL